MAAERCQVGPTAVLPPLCESARGNSQTGFQGLRTEPKNRRKQQNHEVILQDSASYLMLLYAGRRRRAMGKPSVMLQSHDEDLHCLLHQLLPVVGEEQVVVGDAVAHRVVGTHHIQQRGEQRQRVSVGTDGVSTCVQALRRFGTPSHHLPVFRGAEEGDPGVGHGAVRRRRQVHGLGEAGQQQAQQLRPSEGGKQAHMELPDTSAHGHRTHLFRSWM